MFCCIVALVLLGTSSQRCNDLLSAQNCYERALQWIESVGDEPLDELGGQAKAVLADEYSFGKSIH